MDISVSDIPGDWEGEGEGEGEGYRQMSNSEFSEFCPTEERMKLDLYPEPLRAKI